MGALLVFSISFREKRIWENGILRMLLSCFNVFLSISIDFTD